MCHHVRDYRAHEPYCVGEYRSVYKACRKLRKSDIYDTFCQVNAFFEQTERASLWAQMKIETKLGSCDL